MKKLPFAAVLSCTGLLLGCTGFLGWQCLSLGRQNQVLETQASQLQKTNSDLNAQLKHSSEELEDSSKELEKQEAYLEGQEEYISELSAQINSLAQEKGASDSEEDEDASFGTKDSEDPYPSLYANVEDPESMGAEKIAYLTFDDGPSNLTPKVLDLLDQYDAKATFFVVCQNNEEYEEYLSEIVKRGHTLALHSYSHDYNKIYASKDAFLKDYQQVFDWVVENANYTPSLFRFPGGSNNGSSYVSHEIIQEMKARGFQYFDWNVSSGDGSNLTTTSNIIDNICNNIGHVDTPVVLMHDGSGKNATLAALPDVLKNLSQAGYQFHALDKTVPAAQFR